MNRLPIDDVLPALRQALAERHEAVLEAPPGAGKTTRVPLALLGEPWLAGQSILMLEPRRLAARAAAAAGGQAMDALAAERGAVTAALVNLYYPPEPGRTRPKVVTIEVTSKGRLNLHKFDAKMQAQLEGYLVAVGILQKGQTLSAQELPPETDAVSSSSAYED